MRDDSPPDRATLDSVATADQTVTRVGLGETPEGENSAYALPERGVVVDPGPPTDAAWRRLREGIESVTSLDAVDHVLVTHWHVDHAGLAPRLADAADATLHLHADDAPLVADYAAARERRLARDADRLREWGVPEAVVDRLVDGDDASPMPDVTPVSPLDDGDRVAGVECLHTPGHTRGHAAFLVHPEGGSDSRRDGGDVACSGPVGDGPVALVGDLVLPGTTPNVGGGDTRLSRPLPAYLDSLDRLERRVGAPTVHPGHGRAFELGPRLDDLRAHHESRLDRCVAVVEEARDAPGSRATGVTPWRVATALFGEMAGVHAKMGAGEAASHLAAAAEAVRLARVADRPVRYRPV